MPDIRRGYEFVVIVNGRRRKPTRDQTEIAMSSDPQSLSKIFTRLYATFLKSLFYDDIGFEVEKASPLQSSFTNNYEQPNIATELDLGTILNEHHAIIDNLEDENISSHERRIFREDEIVGYGMPDRRQASPGLLLATFVC